MKLSTPLYLAVLGWQCTFAQDTPTEVTDEQIASYQQGIETGCRGAGLRKGDPLDRVDAFCTCVMKVLRSELTPAEWRQAYFHAARHEEKEERAVMAPHLQSVATCGGAL